MATGLEHVYPRVVLHLGPVAVRDTVTTTWLLMAVLIGFGFWFRRHLSLRPGRLQNAFEALVTALLDLVAGIGGREDRRFLPLLLTLGLYITLANVVGIVPGFHPPTRDLSTPLALAVVVFGAVHVFGVRTWGLAGYLRHYLQPWYLLPIRLIEEVSRTISLSVRLFGNIMGETVLVGILVLLTPLFLPVPVELFSLFTAVIQAYIFCVLALVYLAGATQASAEDAA